MYTKVEGTGQWTTRPSSQITVSSRCQLHSHLQPLPPPLLCTDFYKALKCISDLHFIHATIVVFLNVFREQSTSKYEIIGLTVRVLWVAGSAEQCTVLLSLCFCWVCLITERWFIMLNSIPRHQDCHYCSSEVSLRVRSSPHCVEMDLQNIWGALERSNPTSKSIK